MKTMLIFNEDTLEKIFMKFTNGQGDGIKYAEFCQFIMGSGKGDSTSVKGGVTFQGLAGQKLIQGVQRLVREQWKVIWTTLQHQDPRSEGTITRMELRDLLRRYDMVFTDLQWEFLADQCCDEDDEDELNYHEFMALFPPYY